MTGSLSLRARTHQATLMIFLATVAMLFATFAAAYLVRRASPDWRPAPLPWTMWLGAGLLVLGAAPLEWARRSRGGQARAGLLAAALAGVAFAAAQSAAWVELAREGAFGPASPHRSFLYVLTAVHGVHLLGGLVAITVAARRPMRTAVGLCALYWHFLAAVWLSMLALVGFVR